jgi:hypothetical protein
LFGFGVMAGGPEYRDSWAAAAVDTVRKLLAKDAAPGKVTLILHVGGSLMGPDWVGPGNRKRRASEVSFDVGVPLPLHDDRLEGRLIDFVEEAMHQAAAACGTAGVPFDEAGHAAIIASARESLAALPEAAERRVEHRPSEVRAARRLEASGFRPEAYPLPGRRQPMIRIDFAWDDQDELDALFALEDHLTQALEAQGLGEVDGNEVGDREYALFVSPAPRLKARARTLVDERIQAEGLDRLLAPLRTRSRRD